VLDWAAAVHTAMAAATSSGVMVSLTISPSAQEPIDHGVGSHKGNKAIAHGVGSYKCNEGNRARGGCLLCALSF
jgi:hypothetical protein